MPYKSEAQRRFFNSEEGKKKIGAKEVEHWNEVSKGKKLPEKVKKNKDSKNIYDEVKEIFAAHTKDAPKEGYIPQNIKRDANRICQHFSGWKRPNEIPRLYSELEKLGIDEILVAGYPDSIAPTGAKSWRVRFNYLGVPCVNSYFIYDVYEGQGEKNEYNMYFS